MSALRVALPIVAFVGLVAACTSVDEVAVGDPIGSKPVGGQNGPSGRPGRGVSSSGYDDGNSSYGYPGTSSGYNPYPYDNGTSSSGYTGGPQPLEVGKIASIKVTTDTCSKPPGVCDDAQSFVFDFASKKLTTITCIEVGGENDSGVGATQDVPTSHTLGDGDIKTLNARLADIRVTDFDVNDGGGGNGIKTLDVTYLDGSKGTYSTYDTSCVPSQRRVTDATTWQALYDAIANM